MADELSGPPVVLLHQSQYVIETKGNIRKNIPTDLNKMMVSPNREVYLINCKENYSQRKLYRMMEEHIHCYTIMV